MMQKWPFNFKILIIVPFMMILVLSVKSQAAVDNVYTNPKDIVLTLSLKKAWEMVQAQNADIKAMFTRYELDKSGIARSEFSLYYPSLNFQANYGTGMTVYQIPGSSDRFYGDANKKRGAPSMGMGINLSDYNLYNSGIDALQIKNIEFNKLSMEMNFRTSMNDKRKSVIDAYFNIVNQIKTEEAFRKNVNFLEAILGLIKIKAKLKKVPEDVVSRAEIDLNNAQQALQNEEMTTNTTMSQLNTLLNLEQDQKLKLTTDIPVLKVKMTSEQIEERFKKFNVGLKQADFSIQRSRMDVERSFLELFPVKISMNGGVWSTNLNKYSQSANVTGNVDVNLGVSVSMPLMSGSGFLNSRDRAERMINLKLNEDSYDNTLRRGILDFKFFLSTFKDSEGAIEQERKNFEKISDFLNAKIETFSSDSSSLLEMRELLDSVKNQEINYNKKVLDRFNQVQSLYLQLDMDIMAEIPE